MVTLDAECLEKGKLDGLKRRDTNSSDGKAQVVPSANTDRILSNHEFGSCAKNSLSFSHNFAATTISQANYSSHKNTGRRRSKTSAYSDDTPQSWSSRSAGSTYTKTGSWFHRSHLSYVTSSVSLLPIIYIRSWIAAMVYLNEPLLATHRLSRKKTQGTLDSGKAICAPFNQPYLWLLRPIPAATPWHDVNNDFLCLLHKSRGM